MSKGYLIGGFKAIGKTTLANKYEDFKNMTVELDNIIGTLNYNIHTIKLEDVLLFPKLQELHIPDLEFRSSSTSTSYYTLYFNSSKVA